MHVAAFGWHDTVPLSMETLERKLVAILSADVVGYSRLMSADEIDTIRRITAWRRDIREVRRFGSTSTPRPSPISTAGTSSVFSPPCAARDCTSYATRERVARRGGVTGRSE
jgi:hypothetical protein